jgi:DNA-binding transcriptional regulator YiaG
MPTPDDIKAVREAAGLIQAEAADMLHVSLRVYQGWEAKGVNHRQMPAAAWELFIMKVQRLGMKLPDHLDAYFGANPTIRTKQHA